MTGITQASFLILFLVSWNAVALAVTCPPSASILTETSRDKILNIVNRDRELIRRGELLLSNGEYALQGAFMKNLTWDCNVEENLVENVEALCNESYGPYTFFVRKYATYLKTNGNADVSIDDNVDIWINDPQFNAANFLQLQSDTKYINISNQFTAYYLSDIGKTIGCTAYQCVNHNKNYAQLVCKTSSSVDENDYIYIPGNPSVVTTPAPTTSCPIPESLLSPANRERILQKMNEKRTHVLNGTLLLDNGQFAIQAQEMPMLTWDCGMEAKMQEIVGGVCSNPSSPKPTNTSSWIDDETYNTIDYYVHELSKTGVQYVKFKTNTTNAQAPFRTLDIRLLHDKASKVGCAIAQCTWESRRLNGVIDEKQRTELLCTFDVNWANPAQVYQARSNTPTTTTTTTTEPSTTVSTPPPTTTTPPPYNPCPTGWFFFSNACYRYVSGSNRSHAQAEQWCVNQGKKGHLVSIHSEAENNFIKNLILSGGDNVLIGYINQAWTDNTSVDYTNFLTGSDTNACAVMSSPNFQWKSADCNGPFNQFLCKRNL